MKRGDVVHSPAGWALVEEIVWVPHDSGSSCFVVVSVDQEDGSPEERPRVYRRDELELAVAAHQDGRDE